MLRKLVFPEPEGPVTDTNSPAQTSRLKSRSAWVSTKALRYIFLMARMLNILLSLMINKKVEVAAGAVLGRNNNRVTFLQAAQQLYLTQISAANRELSLLSPVVNYFENIAPKIIEVGTGIHL